MESAPTCNRFQFESIIIPVKKARVPLSKNDKRTLYATLLAKTDQ